MKILSVSAFDWGLEYCGIKQSFLRYFGNFNFKRLCCDFSRTCRMQLFKILDCNRRNVSQRCWSLLKFLIGQSQWNLTLVVTENCNTQSSGLGLTSSVELVLKYCGIWQILFAILWYALFLFCFVLCFFCGFVVFTVLPWCWCPHLYSIDFIATYVIKSSFYLFKIVHINNTLLSVQRLLNI